MTDQPDTVQHEGEIYATIHWVWDEPHIEIEGSDIARIVYPLADPEKPVRVRLELRAVRVEEESDGDN